VLGTLTPIRDDVGVQGAHKSTDGRQVKQLRDLGQFITGYGWRVRRFLVAHWIKLYDYGSSPTLNT
jgi:hypothetical protein